MKSVLIRFFIVLVCWSGLVAPLNAAMPTKKVLLVVASRNYLESEYLNTRRALETAGISVEVASDAATATGYSFGAIRADLLIGQANAADYAAIAVIGGTGAKELLWEHAGLRTLLQRAHVQGRIVAALCAAPPVLANAGLLKGLKATMWPDPQWIATLEAGGARYLDAPIVIEGRVITGKNPAAAPAFGASLAEAVLRGD
ncbi:MAG: hypothetical protein BSR46_04725 [Candidatus Dactylopiibacterium carminicum]|nr:DJ-1/PfpI family protein [Candidatus Dactylopiibacterium carminicum]PAT00047.1 MAG: hypothetical protein BSR46_04725 [Candidatus Dactylopiibacterium carminicum]